VRARRRRRGQRVERQLGRRRVGGEGAHAVQAADGQRAEALAQRGFERRLPAAVDVHLRPQPGQRLQPVAAQPGLELAVGLHLLLQRAQGSQPGAGLRQRGGLAAGAVLRGAALLVERGELFLLFVQPRFGLFALFAGGGFLGSQRVEPRRIGRRQAGAFARQPLAPRVQRPRAFVDVAVVGGQQLDLLLHLRHGQPLPAAGGLRGAQRVVQRRQGQHAVLGLRGQHGGLLVGGLDAQGDVVQLAARRLLALGPLRVLRTQLGQPLPGALAAVDDVADALFEPAHFQRRFGQFALLAVQRIAGLVLRLPQRLQLGFQVAQLGQLRLQVGGGLFGGAPRPGFLAGGVAGLEEPQLVQLQRAGVLQCPVLRGHLGLLFELVQVVVQLAQDVLDARQVLARVPEPVLGLAPALLVLADAGGFFEEQAQLLGPALDDAADRALADDRVGARAQAGAEEHVLHVAPAHRLVVDVVAAGAVARQHALDGDLGEAVPLAAGARAGVVEHQLHAGAAGRLALARAVEDDVLHRLAAQLAGLAFAQHPAHGVHDVALAAAVGPDDAHALPRQLEGGGLGEGLEARELDLVQAHARIVGRGPLPRASL
jgi:hypothetical protein